MNTIIARFNQCKYKLKIISVLLVASFVVSVCFTATAPTTRISAAPGNILPSFDIGQNWYVCRGYNFASHAGEYALDLVGGPWCDNSATNRNVRTPVSGTVAGYQPGYGNLCINIAGGRSITLTHIDAAISGNVSAGQVVGTVASPGQRGNGSVAHIHLQTWPSPNCYNGAGTPFDSTNNLRICGAPDLTASGPAGTGNGTWSGTSFTGDSCGDFLAAFNSGNLWYTTLTTTADTNLGMAPNTSPSVAKLSNGSHVIAFQANTGELWITGDGTVSTQNLGYGMAPGTSPSVTALNGGGWQVAFQANTG